MNIFVTIRFVPIPEVLEAERMLVEQLGVSGFYHVICRCPLLTVVFPTLHVVSPAISRRLACSVSSEAASDAFCGVQSGCAAHAMRSTHS